MGHLITKYIDTIVPMTLQSYPGRSGYPGLTLGSVGGGPAYHKLFRNPEAPHLFSSTQALQGHMDCLPSLGSFPHQHGTRTVLRRERDGTHHKGSRALLGEDHNDNDIKDKIEILHGCFVLQKIFERMRRT